MNKKYFCFFITIGIAIIGLIFINWFQAKAITPTTVASTINYSEFADTKIMPWLDKVTVFFMTFLKQAEGLVKQIFTMDFLNISLKFLGGIWNFVRGIFKLFFDLLAKTFNK